MDAMQKDVRTRPRNKGRTSTSGVPNIIIPAINGTSAIPRLYRKPLMLSPNTMAFSDIGAESNRSKVFVLRSIGMDTGSIDDAEKRMVIAIRPGIRTVGPDVFPTEKARNMKRGNNIPETMMFGLM